MLTHIRWDVVVSPRADWTHLLITVPPHESWGGVWSLSLITLIPPSLYKEHIWCSYVISSMNKKNAFNQRKLYLLLLSCLPDGVQSGLRAPTLMWLLLFSWVPPLDWVSCSFALLTSSREQTACCYQCPKTSHGGALFVPLLFSGPLQSTLGVVSPLRLCPVLCLWPVLCTVVLPLLSYGASRPLKKPGGTDLRCNV